LRAGVQQGKNGYDAIFCALLFLVFVIEAVRQGDGKYRLADGLRDAVAERVPHARQNQAIRRCRPRLGLVRNDTERKYSACAEAHVLRKARVS
jgi:hypothetical protein